MFVKRARRNDELGCAEDRFEAAETISNVGRMPIAGESPTDFNGAEGNYKSANPAGDLPLDCWHHVVQHLNPPSLARAAAVSRTLRDAAYDDRLWQTQFERIWSPEYCGSMQTARDGKDFRQFCGQWSSGRPGAVDVIMDVHRHQRAWLTPFRAVNNVKLSQAGALAAWTLGGDEDLVCTDLTTCQTRYRIEKAIGWMERWGGTSLAVFDSLGLVCTGGQDHGLAGWDPRAKTPSVFAEKDFNPIFDMLALEASEGHGSPQLLLGSWSSYLLGNNRRTPHRENLQLWDLRQLDGGPIRKFRGEGVGSYRIAYDPRHGTVFAGDGHGYISCWDFQTGNLLSSLVGDHAHIYGLVVGKDCLLSRSIYGTVTEWEVHRFTDVREDAEPPVPHVLAEGVPVGDWSGSGKINCMQGLGEGPAGVLAGTEDGRIILLGCQNQDLPLTWPLGEPLQDQGYGAYENRGYEAYEDHNALRAPDLKWCAGYMPGSH